MVSFHSFTFLSALLAIFSAHVASSLPLTKRGFISLPLQRMDRRIAADPQLVRLNLLNEIEPFLKVWSSLVVSLAAGWI